MTDMARVRSVTSTPGRRTGTRARTAAAPTRRGGNTRAAAPRSAITTGTRVSFTDGSGNRRTGNVLASSDNRNLRVAVNGRSVTVPRSQAAATPTRVRQPAATTRRANAATLARARAGTARATRRR